MEYLLAGGVWASFARFAFCKNYVMKGLFFAYEICIRKYIYIYTYILYKLPVEKKEFLI